MTIEDMASPSTASSTDGKKRRGQGAVGFNPSLSLLDFLNRALHNPNSQFLSTFATQKLRIQKAHFPDDETLVKAILQHTTLPEGKEGLEVEAILRKEIKHIALNMRGALDRIGTSKLAGFLCRFLPKPDPALIGFLMNEFNLREEALSNREGLVQTILKNYPADESEEGRRARKLLDTRMPFIIWYFKSVRASADLIDEYSQLHRPKTEAERDALYKEDPKRQDVLKIKHIKQLQKNIIAIFQSPPESLSPYFHYLTENPDTISDFIAASWYAAVPHTFHSKETAALVMARLSKAKDELEQYTRLQVFYSKANEDFYAKAAFRAKCFHKALSANYNGDPDQKLVPIAPPTFENPEAQSVLERTFSQAILRALDDSDVPLARHVDFTKALKSVLTENQITAGSESQRSLEYFISRYFSKYHFKKILRLFDPLLIPEQAEHTNVRCLILAFIHSNAVKFETEQAKGTKRKFLKLIEELCSEDAAILAQDNTHRRRELIMRVLELVNDEQSPRDSRYFMMSAVFFMLQRRGFKNAMINLLDNDKICQYIPQNTIVNLSLYDQRLATIVCDADRFYKVRFLSDDQANRILIKNPQLLDDKQGAFSRFSHWVLRLPIISWFLPKSLKLGDNLELFRVFDNEPKARRTLTTALDKNPIALRAFFKSNSFKRASLEQKARLYLEAAELNDGHIRKQFRHKTRFFGLVRSQDNSFIRSVLRCKEPELVQRMYQSLLAETPDKKLTRYFEEIKATMSGKGQIKLAGGLTLERAALPNRDQYLSAITQEMLNRFFQEFPQSPHWQRRSDRFVKLRELMTAVLRQPKELTTPMVKSLFSSPGFVAWLVEEGITHEVQEAADERPQTVRLVQIVSADFITQHGLGDIINARLRAYLRSAALGTAHAKASIQLMMEQFAPCITAETMTSWLQPAIASSDDASSEAVSLSVDSHDDLLATMRILSSLKLIAPHLIHFTPDALKAYFQNVSRVRTELLSKAARFKPETYRQLLEQIELMRSVVMQEPKLYKRLGAEFLLNQFVSNTDFRRVLSADVMIHSPLIEAAKKDSFSLFKLLTLDQESTPTLALQALADKNTAINFLNWLLPSHPTHFSRLQLHGQSEHIFHAFLQHNDYDMTVKLLSHSPQMRDALIQNRGFLDLLSRQTDSSTLALRQAVIDVISFDKIQQAKENAQPYLKAAVFRALDQAGRCPDRASASMRAYFVGDLEQYKAEFEQFRQGLKQRERSASTAVAANRGRAHSKPEVPLWTDGLSALTLFVGSDRNAKGAVATQPSPLETFDLPAHGGQRMVAPV